MTINLTLTPLSSRRKISRLTLFHKLYHQSILRDELIGQPQYPSPRIDHRYQVSLGSRHNKSFSVLICLVRPLTRTTFPKKLYSCMMTNNLEQLQLTLYNLMCKIFYAIYRTAPVYITCIAYDHLFSILRSTSQNCIIRSLGNLFLGSLCFCSCIFVCLL